MAIKDDKVFKQESCGHYHDRNGKPVGHECPLGSPEPTRAANPVAVPSVATPTDAALMTVEAPEEGLPLGSAPRRKANPTPMPAGASIHSSPRGTVTLEDVASLVQDRERQFAPNPAGCGCPHERKPNPAPSHAHAHGHEHGHAHGDCGCGGGKDGKPCTCHDKAKNPVERGNLRSVPGGKSDSEKRKSSRESILRAKYLARGGRQDQMPSMAELERMYGAEYDEALRKSERAKQMVKAAAENEARKMARAANPVAPDQIEAAKTKAPPAMLATVPPTEANAKPAAPAAKPAPATKAAPAAEAKPTSVSIAPQHITIAQMLEPQTTSALHRLAKLRGTVAELSLLRDVVTQVNDTKYSGRKNDLAQALLKDFRSRLKSPKQYPVSS